ncbi:hypothetical protein [Streptomyces sediminimaris]|uniref:hypothetical protein n=1 Tax=Streptomyces sediminimaris TaxID=3383721 RepID=UPI00399A0831
MNGSRIARPTEAQAIARAHARPRPPASMPVLFAALITARTMQDREGARLLACAIVRGGGAR